MADSGSLASCLYLGTVFHERRVPVRHAFTYTLFQFYLDLDELESVFRRRWLVSASRPALARFRRSDHLGDPRKPLDTAVRELVEQRLGWRPEGPVRLLTHLRYFGFVMNPVSFYYCFEADGKRVAAVVAEVNNTPWNEQHCYVLDWRKGRDEFDGDELKAIEPKVFHVSPFMNMGMDYHWRVTAPEEHLLVHIENFVAGEPRFEAILRLQRKPLNSWTLAMTLLQFPWMTLRVYLAIHWQALRLWMKGVPYVPHPGSSANQ